MDEILKQESVILNHFNSDDAWTIGVHLRNRLRELSDKPAVVNIALANSNNLLFHATSRPGIAPDNDLWVARKRKTVLRWGVSSWFMHIKNAGNEKAFAEKFMLGESAGEYAIHGGGVPVRVKEVEGVVAVIVVSGLAQHEVSIQIFGRPPPHCFTDHLEQDHQIIVDTLQMFQKENLL